MSSKMSYLVTLKNLGNCENNDFDFLYIPCIMTIETYAKIL